MGHCHPFEDESAHMSLLYHVGRAYISNVTRFKVLAAAAMILLPVAMEPVKLIFAISGWSTKAGPREASPPRAWTTPTGKTLFAISTIFRAE